MLSKTRSSDYLAASAVFVGLIMVACAVLSELIFHEVRQTQAATGFAREVALTFTAYVLLPALTVSLTRVFVRWCRWRHLAQWHQVCCRGMPTERRIETNANLTRRAVGSGTKLLFALSAALLAFVLLRSC